jgi:phenylacetate-CoA ligase
MVAARSNLVSVSSNQRKDRVLSQIGALQKHAIASPESQSQAQFKALQGLLNHVLSFPFWRDRFGAYLPELKSSTNLQQLLYSLPIMTRSDYQAFTPWSRLWVQGSTPADYASFSTSGSTGKPVTVSKFAPVQDFESMAIEALDFIWQKIDVTKPMLSYTSRTPPEDNPSILGEPHNYYQENTGPLFFRKLEQDPIHSVVDLIFEKGIETALMSPTVIRHFMAETSERDMSGFPLKNFVSFADRVDLGIRQLVKDSFDARIIDRYSTTEFGFLAIQCEKHEHLHALQFNNLVEIVDENNRPVEPGQPGRVLVTALTNFATPLIRYEVGDIASWAEPCDTGVTLPVLTPEIVRQRESYRGDNGIVHNILPDKASFAKNPSVRDFQLLIFDDKQVLLLTSKQPLSEQELAAYKKELKEITGLDRPSEVLWADHIPWLGGWKRKNTLFIGQICPEELSLDELAKFMA